MNAMGEMRFSDPINRQFPASIANFHRHVWCKLIRPGGNLGGKDGNKMSCCVVVTTVISRKKLCENHQKNIEKQWNIQKMAQNSKFSHTSQHSSLFLHNLNILLASPKLATRSRCISVPKKGPGLPKRPWWLRLNRPCAHLGALVELHQHSSNSPSSGARGSAWSSMIPAAAKSSPAKASRPSSSSTIPGRIDLADPSETYVSELTHIYYVGNP